MPNVLASEPLPYGEFTRMLSFAYFVPTDSGGVQEEAPSFAKPVLVMRENTERPEAVVAGTVRLIGTGEAVIVIEVNHLLTDQNAFSAIANAANPYGDCHAAARTAAASSHLVGNGSRLPEFSRQILSGTPSAVSCVCNDAPMLSRFGLDSLGPTRLAV